MMECFFDGARYLIYNRIDKTQTVGEKILTQTKQRKEGKVVVSRDIHHVSV